MKIVISIKRVCTQRCQQENKKKNKMKIKKNMYCARSFSKRLQLTLFFQKKKHIACD